MAMDEIGKGILAMVSDYHNAVGALFAEVLSDSMFDIKLVGYGFDGHSVLCGVTNARCSDVMDHHTDHFGILANTGTRALHVLKTFPESTDIDNVFHVCPDHKTHTVDVFLKQHHKPVDFVKIDNNIDLSSCFSKIGNNKKDSLFCSSQAQKCIQMYGGYLALVRPNMLFTVEAMQSKTNITKPLQNIGADMQGIKCDFALFFQQKPEHIQGRILDMQNHQWPGKKATEELLQCGVYLVPSQRKENSWEPDFVEMECCLLRHMESEMFQVVQDMRSLGEVIAHLSDTNLAVIQVLLCHSVYWYLSSGEWCSGRNSEITIGYILGVTRKGLEEQRLSHYFMPELNLLEALTEDNIANLQDIIGNMGESKDLLERMHSQSNIVVSLQNMTGGASTEDEVQEILQNVLTTVASSVSMAFLNTIKVTKLKLFQQLHQYEEVESCISTHKRALSFFLEEQSSGNKRMQIYRRFVSSCLANLYLHKAKTLKSKSKKQTSASMVEFTELVKTAESLCKINKDITATLKLANIYFVTERYIDCLKSTSECLKWISTPQQNSERTSSLEQEMETTHSTVQLFQQVEDCFQDDILFSSFDKLSIPGFFKNNLRLTASPLVGVGSVPVYTFNTEVFARFLHSMSLFHLGMTAEAHRELEETKTLCDLSEFDCNEKRIVAYYNILGNCFLEIGNEEEAKQAFTKSVALIPSPANPARFALMSWTQSLKKFAQKGIILTGSVVAIAIAWSVIKSRW